MEVKWIKIVTDIFDDEKMLLIESLPDADGIIVCWFKLLCLAGKQNNSGVLMLNDRIAYTDEMLATVFRRPLQTVRLALETFERFGMIEIVNGTITIPNWEKHQNIDGLEKVRAQTRERVSRFREKQKQLTGCSVTVTESNATESDKKENKKENKNISSSIPTLEEVRKFASDEKMTHVDPTKFFTHYETVNWTDSTGKPINDWKRLLKACERSEKNKPVHGDSDEDDSRFAGIQFYDYISS